MLPADNRRALLLSLLSMVAIVTGCGARGALQLPGDNEAAGSAAVSGSGGAGGNGAGGTGAGGTGAGGTGAGGTGGGAAALK